VKEKRARKYGKANLDVLDMSRSKRPRYIDRTAILKAEKRQNKKGVRSVRRDQGSARFSEKHYENSAQAKGAAPFVGGAQERRRACGKKKKRRQTEWDGTSTRTEKLK